MVNLEILWQLDDVIAITMLDELVDSSFLTIETSVRWKTRFALSRSIAAPQKTLASPSMLSFLRPVQAQRDLDLS
jgi:hypothetical protein